MSFVKCSSYSLALLTDETVVGWRSDSSGQLIPPYGVSQVMAIAVGGSHSLAVVNRPPLPAPMEAIVMDEGSEFALAVVAVDPDVPGLTLTFSLGEGALAGAAMNPATAPSCGPPARPTVRASSRSRPRSPMTGFRP